MNTPLNHYLIYCFDNDNCTISIKIATADKISQAMQDENCIKRVTLTYQDVFLQLIELSTEAVFIEKIFDEIIANITKGRIENQDIINKLITHIDVKNNIFFEYYIYLIINQHQASREITNSNIRILLFSMFMNIINASERKKIIELKNAILSFFNIYFFDLINKKIYIPDQLCCPAGWYYTNNANNHHIIQNDITPFIIDFVTTIQKYGYCIKQCHICNAFYLNQNYEKINLCSDKCKKKHNAQNSNQTKKEQLTEDNITKSCYFFQDTWTREIKKYSNFMSEEEKENFKRLAAKRSDELRKERDKISKQKKGNQNFYEMLTTFETERTNLLSPYMEDLKNGEHKETQ